ncbi:hypothetical protein OY671_007173 [Metschnikowia pulcherrima]|nr:hypothetical protein OY671_007173 [Metschnikowia pulcherrima]
MIQIPVRSSVKTSGRYAVASVLSTPATVADDCLSAFNESKLDKRSKFETIETIHCRVQAVFHTWSPDPAPVRSKMVYASSKDALRRAMDGTAADIQGTDFSGVAYDSVLERVGRKSGSY